MRTETCCFTGHRELPVWGRKELAAKLEETIIGLIDRGIRFYGAGGARGWDTLAAQTVLRLKRRYLHIKLILVIPCLTQTKGWPAADVAEYERIKALADKVVYVRKMALNGYVLHVDLAPVKDIVSLQRRCANNLNQIAVRENINGGVYPDEIKALQKDYADLWGPLSELLERLSEVVAL